MKRTEIVFLLDCSGSMAGKEKDTIGGYNQFIRTHDSPLEECTVTTVLFDDRYQLLYDGVPARAAQINESQYVVRGCTALYDAIGRAITKVAARHRQLPVQNRPKTYFVISTDGYENASRKYTARMIRELVHTQQCANGWDVFFIGCDIDAALSASKIGIAAENTYECDSGEDNYFDDILSLLNHRILPAQEDEMP